jgi:hypothetical protein
MLLIALRIRMILVAGILKETGVYEKKIGRDPMRPGPNLLAIVYR